jgi:hypothetical protein
LIHGCSFLVPIGGYRQDLEAIVYTEETSMEEEPTPAQFLDDILYNLTVDNDRDVRFFISEFIHPDNLEAYQKRKAVEGLEVAHNVNNQEETDITATIALPATLTPTSSKGDDNEELAPSIKDLDLNNSEDEEIGQTSAESPMDIVIDDMEENSKVGETMEEEKVIVVGHTMYEENNTVVDHTMEDHEPEAPLKTIKAQEETKDEDVTMLEDDTEMSNEYRNVPEKAQHIYLSKVPVHVVAEKDIMTPATAVTAITHDAYTFE